MEVDNEFQLCGLMEEISTNHESILNTTTRLREIIEKKCIEKISPDSPIFRNSIVLLAELRRLTTSRFKVTRRVKQLVKLVIQK